MVAEVEKSGTVELITAGARDDVDRASRGDAGGEVKIPCGNLELLHHLLGEILLRAAGYRIIHGSAIHRDADRLRAGAQNVDIELAVVLADVRRGYRYTGLQLGKLQEAAAIQRQAVDLLFGHDPIDGLPVEVQLCRHGLHGHHFLGLSYLQAQFHGGDRSGLYRHLLHLSTKTVRLATNFILASLERWETEISIAGGRQLAAGSSIRVSERYRGPRNEGAGCVENLAIHLAGGCLSYGADTKNNRAQQRC